MSGQRSVSALQPYQQHAPRSYRAQMSRWWWLSRPSYVAFVLREVSCVFVAWSVLFLLLFVRAVGDGSGGYADFLEWADTPWVVALNVIALGFVVYHAVTWFQLTPAAVAVRLWGRRLPGAAIAASAYAGWVVVSAFVAWLLLRS
jgi:fumarate reductase subunit C